MTIEQHYIQNQAILTSMYKDQGSGAAGVKPQVKGTNAEVPQSVMAHSTRPGPEPARPPSSSWNTEQRLGEQWRGARRCTTEAGAAVRQQAAAAWTMAVLMGEFLLGEKEEGASSSSGTADSVFLPSVLKETTSHQKVPQPVRCSDLQGEEYFNWLASTSIKTNQTVFLSTQDSLY